MGCTELGNALTVSKVLSDDFSRFYDQNQYPQSLLKAGLHRYASVASINSLTTTFCVEKLRKLITNSVEV